MDKEGRLGCECQNTRVAETDVVENDVFETGVVERSDV